MELGRVRFPPYLLTKINLNINTMAEKLITCKENQIARIVLKIENHLDDLQNIGVIEWCVKVDIQFMLEEITEIL